MLVSQERKPRVLLKISGETLSGKTTKKFQEKALDFIVSAINSVKDICELAIVMGGGNLIRGSKLQSEINLPSIESDYAGMYATVINGVILKSRLKQKYGLDVRILSAVDAAHVAEPYRFEKARHHLECGRIVLLVGGTGNPRFSTDTAMVLRASELEADIILKGTKVDGIYDKDPTRYKDAVLFPHITHMDFINKGLGIIDTTSVTLAKDDHQVIKVFNIFKKFNLLKILTEGGIGSEISDKKTE